VPLFGPNIKKMEEKGDIQGLLETTKNDSRDVRIKATEALGKLQNIDALTQALLKSDKPEVRVTAAQALKGIGSKDAMEALTKTLSTSMRLTESDDDQIEAMIIMQGRAPAAFMEVAFLSDREDALKNAQEPIQLHWVQGLLGELVQTGRSVFSKWFALLTLAELGDRRDEVLHGLIDQSVTVTKAIDRLLDEHAGRDDFLNYALAANKTNRLIDETMRAVALFRGDASATQFILRVFDGEVLRGSYVHFSQTHPYLHPEHKENAIYALGALGDLTMREKLEYLASRGGYLTRYATIALDNFGKATFDEIKARITRE